MNPPWSSRQRRVRLIYHHHLHKVIPVRIITFGNAADSYRRNLGLAPALGSQPHRRRPAQSLFGEDY